MTLRLHLAVPILLFPAILIAQASAPAGQPAATSSGGSYPVMSPAVKARAHEAFQMFINGNASGLWALLSPESKKQWGSAAKFTAINKRMLTQLGGKEQKVLSESFVPDLLRPNTLYTRLSEFEKGNIVTLMGLNERGEIVALVIRPEPNVSLGRYAGYKDVTKLKLPFSGQWVVYQGGRSLAQSGHIGSDEERFAVDFILLDKNSRAFKNNGSTNEDFYCFGQPILAPADGTVVKVQDGFADNDPGKPGRDPQAAQGNYLLINHGNSEFSSFSFVKQNSIKVKKGDKVKQGDAIAQCGSSGGSPAPHITYRLMNSQGYPLPQSLPAQFVDYIADGKPVDSGEPERGQAVSNK